MCMQQQQQRADEHESEQGMFSCLFIHGRTFMLSYALLEAPLNTYECKPTEHMRKRTFTMSACLHFFFTSTYHAYHGEMQLSDRPS